MGLFYISLLLPFAGIVGIIVFIYLLPSDSDIRSLSYTETDRFGRKYRKKFFYPGRFCVRCGRRIITNIPKCPSCNRHFSKDS